MRDTAQKVIKIPAKPEAAKTAATRRQLRVAAYCRVSTKEEDQANSYEVQREYYTDKIMANPAWTMGGIFADKGITGTSAKKREDFMRIRQITGSLKAEVIPFPGGGLSLGDIDRRLAELEVQFQKLLKQATNDPAAYSGQFKDILDEQTFLKEKRTAILVESKHNAEINQRIMDAAELLDRDALNITEWDESVIRQMVETVKVLSKNEIIVTLKGGAEINQRME